MPPIKSTRSCAMLVFRTLGYFLLLSMIATAIAVHFSGDKTYAPAPDKLLINDITGLNATRVNSVIEPVTVEDIIAAIKFTPGKLSIGGGRFSQGGQISATDTLHIDMRHFNKILHLDKDKKEVTVQTGVTWRQLQEFIDPYNLSIKIMQTYANFTIGGSLSVNVHGRYIGEGPLVRSVRSIKMVTADGDIVSAYSMAPSGATVGWALLSRPPCHSQITLQSSDRYLRYQSMIIQGFLLKISVTTKMLLCKTGTFTPQITIWSTMWTGKFPPNRLPIRKG